jgi:hypothetical protein
MKFHLKTVNPWGMMLVGVPVFGGTTVLFFLAWFHFVPVPVQERIGAWFFLVILLIIWPVIWLLKRSFRLASSESEYELTDSGLHVKTIPRIPFMGSRDLFIPWMDIRSMNKLTDVNGSWVLLRVSSGPDLRIVYSEYQESRANFDALFSALLEHIPEGKTES